ncbi:hypothetical protein RCCGE510_10834 [Rhizobium sp. CCGE 510]|nr:hypothetical protein RCCGE510_10834 [Rhizobium sp. CCGE 510]
MNAAISCDVDEVDERIVVGADMGEAVGEDGREVARGAGQKAANQRAIISVAEGKAVDAEVWNLQQTAT